MTARAVSPRRMRRIEKLEQRRAELMDYAPNARKGHKIDAQAELRRVTHECLKLERSL